MSVVIISTLTFVLSTMPELATDIDLILFDNSTDTYATDGKNGETVLIERWDQVKDLFTNKTKNICMQ